MGSDSSSAPRRTAPAAPAHPARRPDVGTVAAELALARWENEGGRPAPRSDPPPVRLGRVYDERTAEDGARVLVDRLWPRGLSRTRADLDEWCKQIAPSAALRRWYGHDPDRFDEFGRRYRAELADPGRAEALGHLRALAQQRTLTLLTATRRVEASEAAVLAELLSAGGRPG